MSNHAIFAMTWHSSLSGQRPYKQFMCFPWSTWPAQRYWDFPRESIEDGKQLSRGWSLPVYEWRSRPSRDSIVVKLLPMVSKWPCLHNFDDIRNLLYLLLPKTQKSNFAFKLEHHPYRKVYQTLSALHMFNFHMYYIPYADDHRGQWRWVCGAKVFGVDVMVVILCILHAVIHNIIIITGNHNWRDNGEWLRLCGQGRGESVFTMTKA